jgi:RNA polymerase sigma-70 factor (ECF subfamily)
VPESESDAALVRRCLAGDGHAMRQLVDRFQADVFGLSVRMLANRHDAEDCAQDVFLRAFRSLKSWDPSRPLRPWIATICVNQCRTRIAKRKNRPVSGPIVEDVPEKSLPSDNGQEVAEAVRTAVDGLRDDYRTVFTLYHEQGRGYDDIAMVMDRPVGTVKTWLHRARAIVLDYLTSRGLVKEGETNDE